MIVPGEVQKITFSMVELSHSFHLLSIVQWPRYPDQPGGDTQLEHLCLLEVVDQQVYRPAVQILDRHVCPGRG